MCTFAVQTVVCGNIVGNLSNPLNLTYGLENVTVPIKGNNILYPDILPFILLIQ